MNNFPHRQRPMGIWYRLYTRSLLAMKLTAVLMLAFTLGVNAASFAQKVNILVKDAKLSEVLSLLKKQSSYRFLYDEDMLAKTSPITVNFRNAEIKEVLDKVLTPQQLEYEVIAGTVTISRSKKNAIPLTKKMVPAVDITVQGTVRDSSNLLTGVSITVKGTPGNGTISNDKGAFSITVSEDAILVFRYMGYLPQEIPVKGRTILDVTMVAQQSMLDEAIVVGYGTQRKINLTGAVDQISSEQLKNRPINNLGSGLQGLIPNLNISIPSGKPNEGANFNIRGTTSINGGSPLILVDNIPFTDAEVARLNPNDIESVTVLKDAASAAIYGARASFGVILITTKSAKTENVLVNLNANTAFRTVGKMPELVTDPYQVMEYKHNAAVPLYNLYPDAVREYAKQRAADPSLPSVIADPTNPQNWMYYGSTNWMEEAYFDKAPTNTVNLSIGKKVEKLSYLFSAEYYRQDGMLRYGKDVYKRYNVRGKVDFNVNKWLTFANNTMLTSSDYDAPTFMDGDFFWNVNRTNSLDVPKNPDGSWTSAGAALLGRMQEGGRTDNKLNEFQTSFSLNATLIKDMWDVKADATFRRGAGKTNSFDVPIPYKTGPDNPIQYAGATTSYAQSRNDNTRYDVFNIYTNVHKQLGDHYLQGLLGYNQEYRNDNWFSARRNGLVSDVLPSVELATGTMVTREVIDDWAVRGLFYRLNYNYKSKYLIELNGRYDGSSRFPKNDRWGFFPSASAGWVLSEEAFFSSLKQTVDMFKIRGSYGSLGNQYVYDEDGVLLNYPYIPGMGTGQIGQILGDNRPMTVNPPSAVASSLTWEKVSTVNLGVDLSLLDNRFEVNFDKYTRYTKDMLVPGKVLPGVFGTASPRFNAADLKTKGWELRFNWRDKGELGGSPFYYNVAFVLADNKAVITKYDNPTGNLKNGDNLYNEYYVGKELGEIWGLQTAGFFQNEEELANHPDQTAVGTDDQGYKFYVGDLKFSDTNNDGKVDFGKSTLDDHGDLTRVGNSSIRYPYSFDLSGGWKGFDLRVFLQGVGKRDWYPGNSQIYFWGVYSQPWTNVTVQNLDHWTPENPNAYFPATRAYVAEDDMQELGIPNERYMQNASYLRVKNITLGYTLPQHWIKRTGLKNVHFYVSGENLFEVSHIKVKLDPEGLEGRIYPFQRTYSFGMNVSF